MVHVTFLPVSGLSREGRFCLRARQRGCRFWWGGWEAVRVCACLWAGIECCVCICVTRLQLSLSSALSHEVSLIHRPAPIRTRPVSPLLLFTSHVYACVPCISVCMHQQTALLLTWAESTLARRKSVGLQSITLLAPTPPLSLARWRWRPLLGTMGMGHPPLSVSIVCARCRDQASGTTAARFRARFSWTASVSVCVSLPAPAVCLSSPHILAAASQPTTCLLFFCQLHSGAFACFGYCSKMLL